MHTIQIAVGSALLALHFEKKELADHFADYFLQQTRSGVPDLDIYIKVRGRSQKSVPNSLFLTKKKALKGFVSGNGLIRGRFSRSHRAWFFRIHPTLISGDFRRVFEQILYQAYYSATRGINTVQVHSCGVIKEDRGYLFVGPSEAGKSTVASLSRDYKVINDEINIIDLKSHEPKLVSTPFNGLFREKKKGKAPLKGIFILNKAPNHGVAKISGSKAVRPLSKEIIPFIGLEDILDNNSYLQMMDKAMEISQKVPIYRMDFLPDSGFWNELDKLP